MRKSISLVALLLASGCGGADQQQDSARETKSYDVAAEPPPAPGSGPAVAPTAAPGIAFNYRYAFRLPGQKIASVQEQHAQACERLGLARCRIAGMRYRLVNERDVEAMLAFKLDPAIARQFGKAGIETVANNEGMLIDSEISGEDAGAAIAAANRSEAQLSDDLERVEAQLGRSGLAAAERDRLQAEAQQLRQTIRSNRDVRDEQRESLATTPVVFEYGSGDLVPGFDTHSPVRQALETAGDNLIGGAAFLFVALATLLPWAALLLLLWWLMRWLGPKLGPRGASGSEPKTAESVES